MFVDNKNNLMSEFPIAIHPDKVGDYDASTKSGGGYFWDNVLEYRVWLHPELGAEDFYDGADYFHSFPTYELAVEFHNKTNGSESPLALIEQQEWIDEPTPKRFLKKEGKRITEWKVEWLDKSKREKDSIRNFLNSIECK